MLNTQVMEQDFDVEPTENVGIPLDTAGEEARAAEPEVERPSEQRADTGQAERSEVPQEETPQAEKEGEETEVAATEGSRIDAAELADQIGWDSTYFYNTVEFKTADGPMSLSEMNDGYNTLSEQNQQLQQEIQQLKETATEPVVPPNVSPEANALYMKAQMLQEQYRDTKWHEMDQNQANTLRNDMRDGIEQLMQAAQHKQAEHQVQVQQAQVQYRQQVDLEVGNLIPAWKNRQTRQLEQDATQAMLRNDYGFSQQEVDAAFLSSKAVKVLHDLWKSNVRQSEVKKGVKAVKKVPKHLGSAPVQGKPDLQSIDEVGKKISGMKSHHDRLKAIVGAEFADL